MTTTLKEKVKNLPLSPGVYLMKDSHGAIIYVGKAKNLKRRVQSYFLHSRAPSQKVEKLKRNIHDFDYILTDTEFEAFFVECQLIKEIKPFFNRRMKSPRSYSYVVIRSSGNQRLDIASSPAADDGNYYFGPFTGKGTVETALQGLKEFYKIDCSNHTKSQSACLNYSLGFCLGICMGGFHLEIYNDILKKIIAFFQGTDKSVLEEMIRKMDDAAAGFDFEKAARYRDYIDALGSLFEKEKMIEFTEASQNIVIVEELAGGVFKLFLVKGNRVLFSKIYELADSLHMTGLINEHFKTASPHSSKLTKEDIDEAQIIYSYLNSNNCKYMLIPEKWLKPRKREELEREIHRFFKEKMESV